MRNLFILSIGILLFMVSCEKSEQQKTFLARVGNSYLFAETAEQYIGSSFDTSDVRARMYVNRWVESELLYQKALNKGYADSQDIEQQLADIRKQLIIQRYLDKEIYGEVEQISESDLKYYYEGHSKEFELREAVVRVNLAVFNDRASANDFRSFLVKGKSWSDASIQFSEDEVKMAALQSNLSSVTYTQVTLYPPELWKVAQNLQKGDASFPVKSGNQFYVIQLLEKSAKGSTANFEAVIDEVKSRLFIEKRREKYDKLLQNLRKEFKVQVNLKDLK